MEHGSTVFEAGASRKKFIMEGTTYTSEIELTPEQQEEACWVLLAKEMEPHFVEAVITIDALCVEVQS